MDRQLFAALHKIATGEIEGLGRYEFVDGGKKAATATTNELKVYDSLIEDARTALEAIAEHIKKHGKKLSLNDASAAANTVVDMLEMLNEI